MGELDEPIQHDHNFETSASGDGGVVPMPSIAAKSRGRSGGPEDQDVAEDHVAEDRGRVSEGYVRPGEPHTD